MHGDKFVKLSAIEKMAKPMKAIHEEMVSDEAEDAAEHECPKCGHMWSETESEDGEDTESEEY